MFDGPAEGICNVDGPEAIVTGMDGDDVGRIKGEARGSEPVNVGDSRGDGRGDGEGDVSLSLSSSR